MYFFCIRLLIFYIVFWFLSFTFSPSNRTCLFGPVRTALLLDTSAAVAYTRYSTTRSCHPRSRCTNVLFSLTPPPTHHLVVAGMCLLRITYQCRPRENVVLRAYTYIHARLYVYIVCIHYIYTYRYSRMQITEIVVRPVTVRCTR